MIEAQPHRGDVYRQLDKMRKDAEAVRVAAKADLQLNGRECPDCGVIRRPDEYGTKRNGEPQEVCKSCLQYRRDVTRASREGFATVEEMREHYAAKKAARDRLKASKRYGKYTSRPYTPPPPPTPEELLKASVRRSMAEALDRSLHEYKLMAELCAEAALTAKYGNQTFGEHLKFHWFTHDDIEPFFLNVTTKQNKRWVGSWPFVCGRNYKPPRPIRAGEYWP